MAEDKSDRAVAEAPAPDIEHECETWAFARPAGVSAQELRQAVRESLKASS